MTRASMTSGSRTHGPLTQRVAPPVVVAVFIIVIVTFGRTSRSRHAATFARSRRRRSGAGAPRAQSTAHHHARSTATPFRRSCSFAFGDVGVVPDVTELAHVVGSERFGFRRFASLTRVRGSVHAERRGAVGDGRGLTLCRGGERGGVLQDPRWPRW